MICLKHNWELVHNQIYATADGDLFWCVQCGCLGRFPHEDFQQRHSGVEVQNSTVLSQLIVVHRSPEGLPTYLPLDLTDPIVRLKRKIKT